MNAIIIQQNARLTNIEDVNRKQSTKLTTLDATVAQQVAKLKTVEATLVQQNVNQITLDATVAQQTAKFRRVDTSIAQQAATQTALFASIEQQRVQLATVDTTLTTIGGCVAKHDAQLTAVETAVARQHAQLAVASHVGIGVQRGVFDNVKSACSQICFRLGGGYYIGSGWFHYDSPDDLRHGYFITAAHCVMAVDDGVLQTLSKGFIQEPTTCNWVEIDVRNVFYDGAADIALIKTNIDLTDHPRCGLRLATAEPSAGDTCYVVGNPGGLDEDSISVGCVRDPHYTEPSGHQITDSIFVTCPGMGGNSGGPIVNQTGDVIGIYTFGSGESFGGGSNADTIRKSLQVLQTSRHNRQKRYLGLGWYVPSPFLIASYYDPSHTRFRPCVCIQQVSAESPFASVLRPGDLLLSAQLPNGDVVEFGNTNEQKTPGVLLYYYEPVTVQIRYVRPNREQLTAFVTLNRSYDDVSSLCDGPLHTGLLRRPSQLLLPTVMDDRV